MIEYPLFLSVVIVTRNDYEALRNVLEALVGILKDSVNDYELLVVDNASDDDSVLALKNALKDDRLPNVQVFALTKRVSYETAAWAGAEHALGDFVALIDPLCDDVSMLAPMLAKATTGYEVVFARNQNKKNKGWSYRLGASLFDRLYQRMHGVKLSIDAPHFRLISRSVVNFIQRHGSPELAYRFLPATAGFSKTSVVGNWTAAQQREGTVLDGVDRALQLLIASSTSQPMRAVTALALLGAFGNILYSLYVVLVAVFKSHVAEGWVTLSLQQSAMFFLLSIVLLVLGEYVTHMLSISSRVPAYHIGQEFGSSVIGRRQKLNVEDSADIAPAAASQVANTMAPHE
ncbi:MAG: glycosyltransferase [Pandoraea sp.]|nr:glycosyltransferase [Pandoraea sp.]MDR3396774.1 glycosyltransferase [Pandoraea sp.]